MDRVTASQKKIHLMSSPMAAEASQGTRTSLEISTIKQNRKNFGEAEVMLLHSDWGEKQPLLALPLGLLLASAAEVHGKIKR